MLVDLEETQADRTVLVLGGGGTLGAFQAGGLLALAECGVSPDAVFGSSVGALNGAFLASEPSLSRAQDLARWWVSPRTHQVLAASRWGRMVGLAGAVVGGRALFDERPLRRLVTEHVPAHDIAELAVPLTVTTTCLDCGEAVHHSRGAPGDVLVGSCALPGMFPPSGSTTDICTWTLELSVEFPLPRRWPPQARVTACWFWIAD